MQLSAKASSLRGQIAACVPSSLKLRAPQEVINTVSFVDSLRQGVATQSHEVWEVGIANKLTDMFVRWLGPRTPDDRRSKHKEIQKYAYLFSHGHSMQIFGEIPFTKPQNDI